MRHHYHPLAVALIALSIFFADLARGVAPDGDLIWSRAFDEEMPRLMDLHRVPGVAVALVSGGEPVHAKGYGFAERDERIAVTEDTVFQAASISKPVSAWAAMKLVEDGVLDLDAPVSRFLTRWQLPQSSFDNDRVTLRRILSHTAGLSVGGYQGFAPGQPVQTLEESLSAADDSGNEPVRVVFPPGQGWHYSGGGYTLVQLLIEEASHQSFADFAHEFVLQPLGMSNSSFRQSSQLRPAYAVAYDQAGKRVPDFSFAAEAAAGLRTTSGDLARFVAALMKGPRGALPGRGVLLPGTVHRMLTPQPNSSNDIYRGSEWGLGYGLKRLTPGGDWLVFHPGDNVPGWHGLIAAIPERRIGFVVLTNGQGGRALRDEALCLWLQIVQAGSLSECANTEKVRLRDNEAG